MRNPTDTKLAFCQTLLDVAQQKQFIKDFIRRSLFRHLLDRFQYKLPVAHNLKTMRCKIRKRKRKFGHDFMRFSDIAAMALKCFR